MVLVGRGRVMGLALRKGVPVSGRRLGSVEATVESWLGMGCLTSPGYGPAFSVHRKRCVATCRTQKTPDRTIIPLAVKGLFEEYLAID